VAWILGVSAAGALLLALLLAYWFGHRYARGFTELAQRLSAWRADPSKAQALQLQADNRPARSTESSYELAEIDHVMQHMLGKIDALLQAEREFTASVSHELRTPIAVIRSISERALSDKTDTHHMRLIAQAAQRSEAILATLLTLARSAELNPERVLLLPLLEQVIVELSLARPDAEFDISDRIPADARLSAHPAALSILLHIVLENAILHGTGAARVRYESQTLLIENKMVSASDKDNQGANYRQGFGLQIAERIAQRFGLELRSHAIEDQTVWRTRIGPLRSE
jgi:signal transduction histidine kinase